MKIVLLGPPGSGKGTVAAKAKDYFKIAHISTGDLFRQNIKEETEIGKKVKDLIAKGSLVPDSLTIAMVKNRIKEQDCSNGFILDGFPRTVAQAEALDLLTDIDVVVNFVISDKEVIERLSGRRMCPSTGKTYHVFFNPPKVENLDDETGEKLIQREDDKPESVQHRLEVYKNQTEPLISYYRQKNLLKDLQTSNKKKPEEVLSDFTTLLEKK